MRLPQHPKSILTSANLSYQPLLPRYPQLSNIASNIPGVQIDDGSASASVAEEASKAVGNIDRPLLNSIVLTNRLEREPGLKVCAAEAGGGKCADKACKDLHLSKGVVPIGKWSILFTVSHVGAGEGEDKLTYSSSTLSHSLAGI
ncbi:hypothetical protein IAU59_000925 [Kwoniella sp. CBS 9459]